MFKVVFPSILHCADVVVNAVKNSNKTRFFIKFFDKDTKFIPKSNFPRFPTIFSPPVSFQKQRLLYEA